MQKKLVYISLQEATKYCDYSQEYLSLRARRGKLRAVKNGRNWVTTKEWLENYIRETEAVKLEVSKIKNKSESEDVKRIKTRVIAAPSNLPTGNFSPARYSVVKAGPSSILLFLSFIILFSSSVFLNKNSVVNSFSDFNFASETVGSIGSQVVSESIIKFQESLNDLRVLAAEEIPAIAGKFISDREKDISQASLAVANTTVNNKFSSQGIFNKIFINVKNIGHSVSRTGIEMKNKIFKFLENR